MQTIEVISLIYKSISFCDFIVSQLRQYAVSFEGFDVTWRIVANDATSQVINHLKSNNIPHSVFTNPNPNEYYLNRVYRAWNYGGSSSSGDYICFVNSDMAFSPNWLENLTKHISDDKILTSRLVESGKMPSGKYGISHYFGNTPGSFKESEWLEYSKKISENSIHPGGLYMPFLIKKKLFVDSGMYPEGNVYHLGAIIKSGDTYFFEDVLKQKFNIDHYTVFDSLVYHFQEGEMTHPE